jgi:hypothetical protein
VAHAGEVPRQTDEWRVEVHLDEEQHGHSLGERLRTLDLDDHAREKLGGSVIVTRDGPRMFLYAWHEFSAREAEGMVRDLLEEEGLAGEVKLMRWHPVEEAWRPGDEPLPETEAERSEEERRHELAERRERAESGEHDWEVVVELPDLRATLDYAAELEDRGLSVKRRWKYLLVGALTEEKAVELGRQIEGEAPEGSNVAIRANPDELPHPVFVMLGSLKPGVMRDLGL